MPVQLVQLGTIIDNVGTSVTRYPENAEFMYSYRLRNRFLSKYLQSLETYLEKNITEIEDEKLKENMEKWIEITQRLKKNPFKPNLWLKYFTTYQKVIETSNDLLAEMIGDIQTRIKDEITAESCNYLIQSVELVRDVFSFFYKFADAAKKMGGLAMTQKRLEVFKRLMDSFFEFALYTEDLIKYVEGEQELSEEFIENLTNSFSSLNLALVIAKSTINIIIEEVSISKEAEVALSGYSETVLA